MKVYFTYNGSYGCIPDNVQLFYNKKDAIKYLSSLFELDKDEKKELKETFYLDLNPEDRGAQYCEIVRENKTKKEIEEFDSESY